MLPLVVIGLIVGGLWLVRHAALRFATRQRRLGRWDAEGPLVETAAPYGNRGMNERLEVIGDWHGEILRDRRRQPDVPSTPEETKAAEPAERPNSQRGPHPHRAPDSDSIRLD